MTWAVCDPLPQRYKQSPPEYIWKQSRPPVGEQAGPCTVTQWHVDEVTGHWRSMGPPRPSPCPLVPSLSLSLHTYKETHWLTAMFPTCSSLRERGVLLTGLVLLCNTGRILLIHVVELLWPIQFVLFSSRTVGCLACRNNNPLLILSKRSVGCSCFRPTVSLFSVENRACSVWR